jgi:hypothetical protein
MIGEERGQRVRSANEDDGFVPGPTSHLVHEIKQAFGDGAVTLSPGQNVCVLNNQQAEVVLEILTQIP